MNGTSRTLATLLAFTGLAACGPTSEPSIDRVTGRECFELHLEHLPPGSQYEGVASADGARFKVRVMDGVDLIDVECETDAGGEVRVVSGDSG